MAMEILQLTDVEYTGETVEGPYDDPRVIICKITVKETNQDPINETIHEETWTDYFVSKPDDPYGLGPRIRRLLKEQGHLD